jgi:hypothetical protein
MNELIGLLSASVPKFTNLARQQARKRRRLATLGTAKEDDRDAYSRYL